MGSKGLSIVFAMGLNCKFFRVFWPYFRIDRVGKAYRKAVINAKVRPKYVEIVPCFCFCCCNFCAKI